MATDRDFGNLLTSLLDLSIEEAVTETIDATEEGLVERQKQQLYRGESSDGRAFAPYKPYKLISPDGLIEYADFKNQINPAPGYGNPDYYLTGAYYAAIDAERRGDEVRIFSADEKAAKIASREEESGGNDYIFGLNEESHEAYVSEDFAPSLAANIERTIKLKMV